jgi:hypothetical protein
METLQPCILESGGCQLGPVIRDKDLLHKSSSGSRTCPLPALWTATPLVSFIRRRHAAYPKIGQCQFGVLCFTLEQDVLGFQIWSSAHLVCRVSVLTSMDNALIMQILDCTRDGPDDVLCVPKCQLIQGSKFSLLLVVTTPGADPVK